MLLTTVQRRGHRTVYLNSKEKFFINPLTPVSDQDRISPYNINTMSSRQVTRIKKNTS